MGGKAQIRYLGSPNAPFEGCMSAQGCLHARFTGGARRFLGLRERVECGEWGVGT